MRFLLLLVSCVVYVIISTWALDFKPRTKRNIHSPNLTLNVSSRSIVIDKTYRPLRLLKPAKSQIVEIKRLLIEAEQRIQTFCFKHTGRALKEMYGARYYHLHANLSGCREDLVHIRAGQRLVVVQLRGFPCSDIALRLLPDSVDSSRAFWQIRNGQLSILFPYILSMRKCGRIIHNSIHILPRFENPLYEPDIEVKLGHPDLEKAMKLYFGVNHREHDIVPEASWNGADGVWYD